MIITNGMKKTVLIICLGCLLFFSCSSKFMKYESNWSITKFEVEGKDAIDLIYIYHFNIDAELSNARPPSMRVNGRVRSFTCDIDFYKKNGRDYIKLSDHYYFAGVYEIRCVDKTCCRIIMENERIYMEMDYNGDLPLGKSRDCPEPRTPFQN